MSDELDDVLRRAMKTLDDQVPSGYFEGLPTRTLARLEDSTMQTTGTTGSDRSQVQAANVPPPMTTTKERDEDSGLHDIRSLASSTKLRLSSRRSTQSPVIREDDVLASSSAGWKAVALPEPAKMVSLPELAELPTKAEIEALDKAAQKKVAKVAKAPKAEKAVVAAAPAVATVTEAVAPAVDTPSMPNIGSRIAAQNQTGGRGKMIALVGVGLAAAAGVTIFFAMNNKSDTKTELAYESKASAPLPAMTARQLPAPSAVPAADTAATGGVAAPAAIVETPKADEPEDKPAVKTADKAPKEKVHKVEIRDTVNKDPKPTDKPVVAPVEVKKGGGDDNEPSFDALLKEAGVSDAKKDAKPALEKKSLSGGDIKTGMSSVAGKAASCYAGTQGTAAVKLTVAPSGQVQKVTVTGVFAGTPVAACVQNAVKSATFPAWDGGPQTINYSYLLSE
jgi:hypothetical protein